MLIYDIQSATRPILPFIDDLSNWYVRRSRKRFWKSEDDSDKKDAYKTLHYVLVRLSLLLAPFTPFLSEELYQKMTGGESVHLLDLPQTGKVNQEILSNMDNTRDWVTEGLSIRAKAKVKVRQPLSMVTTLRIPAEYKVIIAEELNVKEVKEGNELSLDLNISDELRVEGQAREVIRYVQNARKNAELQVDDRISLVLSTEDNSLRNAIEQFADEINKETLATLSEELENMHEEDIKIDGVQLKIRLKVT